jgi:hypothetical protein
LSSYLISHYLYLIMLSPLLDTAISMMFLLFLFSMGASFLQELWTTFINERGIFLKKCLGKVLHDPKNMDFAQKLYEHPLLHFLKEKPNSLPAYIPTSFFSRALIDVIAGKDKTLTENEEKRDHKTDFEAFEKGIKKMQPSDFKLLLQSFLTHAHDYGSLEKEIGKWFDLYTQRTSGWYKSKAQYRLMVISVMLTVAAQFDFLSAAYAIYNDQYLQESLSATATAYYQSHPELGKVTKDAMKELLTIIPKKDLPIGWGNPLDWHTPVGWFISALLISLGAPFWFDLLGKVINLRGQGAQPQSKTASS